MIRIDDIKLGLAHLVGWEQGIIPSEQIAEDLTESESGLYYQGAHPMVTLKNLESVMPEMDVNMFPQWNKYKFYKQGTYRLLSITLTTIFLLIKSTGTE